MKEGWQSDNWYYKRRNNMEKIQMTEEQAERLFLDISRSQKQFHNLLNSARRKGYIKELEKEVERLKEVE